MFLPVAHREHVHSVSAHTGTQSQRLQTRDIAYELAQILKVLVPFSLHPLLKRCMSEPAWYSVIRLFQARVTCSHRPLPPGVERALARSRLLWMYHS
jgi:hypothetical protein